MAIATATAAIVAAVVAAAAAAATTTISVEQAKANQKTTEMQLDYQRQVALQNADLEKQQAQDAVRRGDVEASKKMQQIQQFKGSQRSTLASHGLDLSEGTPLDVLAGTDWAGTTDVQSVMHNSALEAWGHKVNEQNYQTDATNLEWQKTASQVATKNMIKGELISGTFAGHAEAGKAFANYYKGQKAPQETPKTGSMAATSLLGDAPLSGYNSYQSEWRRFQRNGFG